MAIRKVLVATLGHVDHGKTSLLDKIRKTAVTKGEAGGITQAVGVSIIPIETVRKICGKLLDALKLTITVPGLLAIDTPGHAAFTSLRKRGGSLADIAIVVVDINEGFKPQTVESIEILKANKVPFIIAANKVDMLHGWMYDEKKFLVQNINELHYETQNLLERKMYELVAQVAEQGLNSERFDRVSDYTQQIALVPVSAKTGQGIPELLMVLTGLAQKFLEKNLHIEETGYCKGVILEVKEDKGLGKTIDAIIYNGKLSVNDTIVVGGIQHPIATKVRALLEPAELAEMREKKSSFKNVKSVTAATGVKIAAPGLDEAVSGMPLRSCSPADVKQVQQELQSEISQVVVEQTGKDGVLIKADTIGALEALKTLLEGKNIPLASASLGNVSKKDLSQLETIHDKDEFKGILVGLNINVPQDIAELAKGKDLKIIVHDVIYKIIEDYEEYVSTLKKRIEMKELNSLVRPCKIAVMKGYVSRQNNPAITGVEIEVGRIRAGDPLMKDDGNPLTSVKAMKDGKDTVTIAEKGKQLAMSMDHITIGRQVNEGDFLYSDIPEEDFKKLKILKQHLTKMEIEVLKEIAEIKRKNNPVWGVG